MRTADVAKLVSKAWKGLPSCERLVFLDMAKKDKERYEVEKANYKGPWKVIDVKEKGSSKRPVSLLKTSPPAIDCVSLSSSQRNGSECVSRLDEDEETLGCFDIMLHSLDDDPSDVMSNSSRAYSVSENTARVTLPDEYDNPMMDSQDMSHTATPYAPTTGADAMYLSNQPGFDAPYPLQPLISTDFGGFLAAAAMLDSCSEPFLE